MSPLDRVIVDFAERILHHRKAVVVIGILLAILAGSGALRLGFDDSYKAFFDKDNPQLTSYEALKEVYADDDSVLVVVEPAEGAVFNRETLGVIEALTRRAWELPFTTRVDSVTNFQYSRGEGDDLIVRDLVEDAASWTDAQIEEAEEIALGDPLLARRLISEDGRATGVNIAMRLSGKKDFEVTEAAAAVRGLVADISGSHPDHNFYLTGVIMMNNAFVENMIIDLTTIVPLMYAGILLIMWLLLRSLPATIGAFVIIGIAAMVGMGFGGAIGIRLTPPSAVSPIMIMTLAVADSIHILVTVLREMRNGRTKDAAIVEGLRLNFNPVFITSLTTAIGFLSLNFSDARPFRDLGNIVTAGVAAAFLYSVIFLPAIISLLPLRAGREPRYAAAWPRRLADFVIRRKEAVFWSSTAIIIALAAAVPRNELDDRWVEYFAEGIRFRTDSDAAMEKLTGIYNIEHSIGSGESGGISRPEYLAKLEEFAKWYESQPSVVHVTSASEVMMRLNKNLHGDDPAFYRVPETRQMAAQYLLLYEMSLPLGLDVNNRINVDKSSTRFTVVLADISARELRALAARAEAWLEANAPEAMAAVGSSPSVMFSHVSQRNLKSMVRGTVIALLLISACLMIAFRSVGIGLLSLIPNIAPAVMGFGIWALLVGEIGLSLTTVTTMTLGIVVDDTVHYLSKYLRARRLHGASPQDAVRYAFTSVGMALASTSIILVAGFSILSWSAFRLNDWMGQLTAITISVALVADFLFLPTLLIKVEEWRKSRASLQPAVSED